LAVTNLRERYNEIKQQKIALAKSLVDYVNAAKFKSVAVKANIRINRLHSPKLSWHLDDIGTLVLEGIVKSTGERHTYSIAVISIADVGMDVDGDFTVNCPVFLSESSYGSGWSQVTFTNKE